jgi:hypothetical protein
MSRETLVLQSTSTNNNKTVHIDTGRPTTNSKCLYCPGWKVNMGILNRFLIVNINGRNMNINWNECLLPPCPSTLGFSGIFKVGFLHR